MEKTNPSGARALPMDLVDLISQARQTCLAVDVLVKLLVTAAQTTKTDERVMVLVYAVEGAAKEAWGAAEKASAAVEQATVR